MKSIGIVRKLDQLGRIVIPIETRRDLSIDTGDSLEIYVDGNSILLKKYEPGCIFCSELKETTEIEGKKVCKKCAARISINVLGSIY